MTEVDLLFRNKIERFILRLIGIDMLLVMNNYIRVSEWLVHAAIVLLPIIVRVM